MEDEPRDVLHSQTCVLPTKHWRISFFFLCFFFLACFSVFGTSLSLSLSLVFYNKTGFFFLFLIICQIVVFFFLSLVVLIVVAFFFSLFLSFLLFFFPPPTPSVCKPVSSGTCRQVIVDTNAHTRTKESARICLLPSSSSCFLSLSFFFGPSLSWMLK